MREFQSAGVCEVRERVDGGKIEAGGLRRELITTNNKGSETLRAGETFETCERLKVLSGRAGESETGGEVLKFESAKVRKGGKVLKCGSV